MMNHQDAEIDRLVKRCNARGRLFAQTNTNGQTKANEDLLPVIERILKKYLNDPTLTIKQVEKSKLDLEAGVDAIVTGDKTIPTYVALRALNTDFKTFTVRYRFEDDDPPTEFDKLINGKCEADLFVVLYKPDGQSPYCYVAQKTPAFIAAIKRAHAIGQWQYTSNKRFVYEFASNLHGCNVVGWDSKFNNIL